MSIWVFELDFAYRVNPFKSGLQLAESEIDGDSEVQDPLKEAVKQILSNDDLKRRFNEIKKFQNILYSF